MRVVLLGLTCVALAGCGGGPRGEVEGTLRRGGKPLADVVVTFLPEAGTRGPKAVGMTDREGRYSLRGDDGKPGVAPGAYRVVVEDLAIYSAPRSPDGTVTKMPPVRFPPSLSDPLQTPLSRRVEAGAQTIDIDLP